MTRQVRSPVIWCTHSIVVPTLLLILSTFTCQLLGRFRQGVVQPKWTLTVKLATHAVLCVLHQSVEVIKLCHSEAVTQGMCQQAILPARSSVAADTICNCRAASASCDVWINNHAATNQARVIDLGTHVSHLHRVYVLVCEGPGLTLS